MNNPFDDPTENVGGPSPALDKTYPTPTQIARFRIESVLGEGGFGVVFRAIDEQLNRRVAIKVPRPEMIAHPDDVASYLREARTVAGLEHPNIVTVLEVGSTPEFPIYVVSKFIDGRNLASWLRSHKSSVDKSLRWITELSDALRQAHKQGIVHRDIKPQNILIDENEKAHLVDFGLALRDEDVGKRLPAGGTPAYMSPEQAKGEGHRVDGRSDLFSLGVVFYELLTNHRPFSGQSRLELLEQITELDPKPLSQWNERIDRELERIVTKLLAKRKSDRYSSAANLLEDLEAYRSVRADMPKTTHASTAPAIPNASPSNAVDSTPRDATPTAIPTETPIAITPGSGSIPLKIVPKGLRSFDEHDADFFLELLPGPRDRNGLPDTIGFWKHRIEERDPDKTFSVGLVYGPSGCGKSSMMKAGLMPRLAKDVVTIYLEATSDQTEATLLNMLRKRLDAEGALHEQFSNLVELLTAVRRGKLLPSNEKLLLVIDQFEQWLYAHTQATGTELLDSLLQCDGSRLQAIVMVRDDFWMAATRIFRDLDIRLVDGHNSAAVDLFSIGHAERVLKAFGRAFGTLVVDGPEDKQESQQFVTDAVRGLSEENKVISVRLSLFAEMMKSRPWTSESLNEVGGTSGVGATFLEETFSASGAPPEHRYHQQAARAVLRLLLPDGGTEIKGHRRSRAELLEASGYAGRDRDFNDLIRILDSELRLITPVDSNEVEESRLIVLNRSSSPSDSNSDSAERLGQSLYYQLTHDYLVPSLRDWLTRKQRETKRGRAELKLAERAATWHAKPENKQLPTLWEWFTIRRLTDRAQWKPAERALMRRANGYHVTRITTAILLAGVLLGAGLWGWRALDRNQKQIVAQKQVDALLQVDSSQLANALEGLKPLAEVCDTPLRAAYEASKSNPTAKLHAAIGLLQLRSEQNVAPELQFAAEQLLSVAPNQFLAIRKQLEPYGRKVAENYWPIATDEAGTPDRRLRAAAALAVFTPDDAHWSETKLSSFLARQLVDANPIHVSVWQEAFQTVSQHILPSLQEIFAASTTSEVQRSLATSLIANYAREQPATLVASIVHANASSFEPLLAALRLHDSKAIAELEQILDRKLEPDWQDSPLDPSWTEPDATAKLAIERAHGMVHERFAFVQSIDVDAFVGLSEQFRACGYRPTRVRPWPDEPDSTAGMDTQRVRISAVFQRDGKRFSIDSDATKESLPAIDHIAERDGLLIEDICPLPAPSPADAEQDDALKFLVVWSEPETTEENRWVLVAADAGELTRVHQETDNAKKFARTLTAQTDANGDRRYCATWSNFGAPSELYYEDAGEDLPYKPRFDLAWAAPQQRASPLTPFRSALAAFEAQPEEKRSDPSLQTEELAVAYYQVGELDKAIAIFDALRAAGKESENGLMFRTFALARMGRVEEARSGLEAFVAANKVPSYVPYAKMMVHAWLREWDLADEQLAKGAETYAKDPDGLYNIACAAALCTSAAAEKEPSRSEAYATRTVALLEQLLALGYTNGPQLQSDPDFNALAEDERFLAFLDKLLPSRPFATLHRADLTRSSFLHRADGLADIKDLQRLFNDHYRPITFTHQPRLTTPSPATLLLHRPIIPDPLKESLALEQARAAIALMRMNATERVWPLLKHQPDPRLRSYLLAFMTQYQIDPAAILERLAARANGSEGTDVSGQRSLIISLGDYAEAKLLNSDQIAQAKTELLRRYAEDPDPGIHGASEWTLKQLGAHDDIKKLRSELATGQRLGARDWYVTRQGEHTFAILHAQEPFLMGSPITEADRYGGPVENDEALHRRQIGRTFAMATHEVTVEQFSAFRPDHDFNRNYARESDAPANLITWYDAAAYCNWLSEREGLPREEWCYDPDQPFADGMVLGADYLQRSGYRLPTEAEWEFACRAGTATARPYGETELLLPRFAWYAENSGTKFALPVGSLRPNDAGLFDTLGNVWEWCQESGFSYPNRRSVVNDKEQSDIVKDSNIRLLRGGSFVNLALYTRSSVRIYNRPVIRVYIYGFRPARIYR